VSPRRQGYRPWRKQRLGSAGKERALLTATLAAAFDSVITVDEHGQVLEFNLGAETTFGHRRAEAIGRPIAELIVPPHLRQQHVSGMRRYLATGERHMLGRRIEIEGMRADGSLFPVELAIVEVPVGGRRLFTAYLRDITDRREAEQALRASEDRYRAIIEDQTEFISRYTADFRLTFVNTAYVRQMGRSREELLGSSILNFMTTDQQCAFQARLAALTPASPTVTYEVVARAPPGLKRWEQWTDRALYEATGQLVEYQSVGRDITEAKLAEQALRASEARFLGAAESIPDGLLILDAEDRIVYYNEQYRELLPPVLRHVLRMGVRFEDWFREGLACGPVYHADMGPNYAGRLAARREERTEREHKQADGRWVRVREARMPDGGHVLLTVDVTARREAEEALKQSETRYRAVVEGQTEFILRLLPNGTVTFVNDAFCRYRRLSREVLLAGIHDVGLGHYPTADQERIRAAWAGLSPARPTVTYELEEPQSGGRCYEEWTDTGIFDETGQLIEIQSVGRDITERKQAENEIRSQREAAHLREKLASLGSLLAGVAHELNNPLSVVVGRAIMLEDEVEDPRARDSLSRLRAAAERCGRIVKTFLALARDKPRQVQPVNIRKVLDAVLDLAYGLRSAGIETYREISADLPLVVADEDQLNQVFLNLLINAQQALETVPPPRRLWLRTDADYGAVRVEVADNGPGVPAELRSRILEPFFTTKPVGAGTGLGLSVCHGIVVAYGGTITVDERPGGGARFIVTLPASHAEAGTTQQPQTEAKIGVGGDVLVVDDEPEVVAMLEEALTRDGYRVVTAPDGVAALELLRQGRFGAVLCDLRMPRLDGPGLARELETIRPDLAARLLFMTGDTLRAAAAVLPAARGQLLEKPLDPEEVRRRVQNLITGVGTAGQVRPPRMKRINDGMLKNSEKKRRG
jgi:PAS domain S-box-containing protein